MQVVRSAGAFRRPLQRISFNLDVVDTLFVSGRLYWRGRGSCRCLSSVCRPMSPLGEQRSAVIRRRIPITSSTAGLFTSQASTRRTRDGATSVEMATPSKLSESLDRLAAVAQDATISDAKLGVLVSCTLARHFECLEASTVDQGAMTGMWRHVFGLLLARRPADSLRLQVYRAFTVLEIPFCSEGGASVIPAVSEVWNFAGAQFLGALRFHSPASPFDDAGAQLNVAAEAAALIAHLLRQHRSEQHIASSNTMGLAPILKLRNEILQDPSFIATRLGDLINLSFSAFANTFCAISSLGIFSPEWLSTSLLLLKRKSDQLSASALAALFRAAAMLCVGQSLPLRLLEPRWLMRKPLAEVHMQARATQRAGELEGLRAQNEPADSVQFCDDGEALRVKLADGSTHMSRSLKAVLKDAPVQRGWYDQSFFENFERSLDQPDIIYSADPSGVPLTASLDRQTAAGTDTSAREPGARESEASIGPDTTDEYSTDVIDVTETWLDEDFKLPRKSLEAESVFLLKTLSRILATGRVSELGLLECLDVLSTLVALEFQPAGLLDAMINRVLIPQAHQLSARNVIDILQSLNSVGAPSAEFLEVLLQRAVGAHLHSYSAVELGKVLILAGMPPLGTSYNAAVLTPLLEKLKSRTDELLRVAATDSPCAQENLSRHALSQLYALYVSTGVEFHALDAYLKNSTS